MAVSTNETPMAAFCRLLADAVEQGRSLSRLNLWLTGRTSVLQVILTGSVEDGNGLLSIFVEDEPEMEPTSFHFYTEAELWRLMFNEIPGYLKNA